MDGVDIIKKVRSWSNLPIIVVSARSEDVYKRQMQVNLPTGVPLVYEFGENFTVKEKAFLGDPAKVAEKMQKVANQGKKG